MTNSNYTNDTSECSTGELAKRDEIDAAADELFPLFCREMDKIIDAFKVAARASDPGAAAKLCHRLKGSAAIYGFRRFADAVAVAERNLLSGDIQAAALLPDLIATSDRIKARDARTAEVTAQPGGGP